MLSTTMTPPGRDESNGPLEILGVAWLVGVHENQIEWAKTFSVDRGQRFLCRPDAEIDPVVRRPHARSSDGQRRRAGVDLERDNPPSGSEGAGEPDGAVAAERADLQNSPCLDHLRHESEQTSLRGRHVDGRQTRRHTIGKRGVERRIGREEQIAKVAFDGGPSVLAHRSLAHRPPLPVRRLELDDVAIGISKVQAAATFRPAHLALDRDTGALDAVTPFVERRRRECRRRRAASLHRPSLESTRRA